MYNDDDELSGCKLSDFFLKFQAKIDNLVFQKFSIFNDFFLQSKVYVCEVKEGESETGAEKG